jgi:hypothetical protein
MVRLPASALALRTPHLFPCPSLPLGQTALFDFSSLCVVLLLLICSAAFVQARTEVRNADDGTLTTWFMVRNVPKQGLMGLMWKFARVGERVSPYVSVLCVVAALHLVLLK